MSTQTGTEFEGWAVVELMGHRKLAGYVRPATVAGAGMLRIDVPGPTAKDESGPWEATQYYAPAALYCLTPVAADVAIRAAAGCRPQPVSRWELPAIEPAARGAQRFDEDDVPWSEEIGGEG